MFIRQSAERTALLTRVFLQEFTTIIEATASMPTERTLILISDGFNLAPGRELFCIASAYFPNEPEWRSMDRDAQPQLNALLSLAQRENVIIYALDSRGVYTPASTGLGDASHRGDPYWTSGNAMAEMARNENTIAWENGSAMSQLASATGGIYFHHNHDLLTGIKRAFDNERERYMIAHTPSNASTDGKYRKFRISVKGKDLQFYAKVGYQSAKSQDALVVSYESSQDLFNLKRCPIASNKHADPSL